MTVNIHDDILKNKETPSIAPLADDASELSAPEVVDLELSQQEPVSNQVDSVAKSAIDEFADMYNASEYNKKVESFELSQDEAIQLKRLAYESTYDIGVVRDNREQVESELRNSQVDLNEARSKAPDTYNYAMRDKNLSIVSPDLKALQAYEEASRPFKRNPKDTYNFNQSPEEVEAYAKEQGAYQIGIGVASGVTDLVENIVAAGAIQGRISPEDAVSYLKGTAELKKKIKSSRSVGYETFQQLWQKELKDVAQAWDSVKENYSSISTDNFFGNVAKTLKSSSATIGEFIDLASTAGEDMGNFTAMMAEQSVNAAPSIALGAMTRIMSMGSLGPVVASVPGGAAALAAGSYVFGSSVPTTAIEYGAYAKNKLLENLGTGASDEQLLELLNNQEKLRNIHNDAVAKGLSTAGTEAAVTLVGGGLVSRFLKGGGIVSNVARGSAKAINEGIGEAAGEAVSGAAVGEKPSTEELLQSFIFGSVMGVPEVFAMGDASTQNLTPENFKKQASAVSNEFKLALGLKDRLTASRNAARATSLYEKAPEIIREIDAQINGEDNRNVVYYQSEDIDAISSESGISTEEVLDLLGVSQNEYVKSKKLNENIEVGKAALDLTKSDDVFNSAANHARPEPGAANVAEGIVNISALAKTAKEASDLYQRQQVEKQRAVKKETEIKRKFMRKFKEQGARADEGILVFEFLKTMGERSGLGLDELYGTYGIDIRGEIAPVKQKWEARDIQEIQSDPGVVSARAQGFNTEEIFYVADTPIGVVANANRVNKDSSAAFVSTENLALNETYATPELIQAVARTFPEDSELTTIASQEESTVGDVYNYVVNKYSPESALSILADAGFDAYSATIEGTPSTVILNPASVKYVEDLLSRKDLKQDMPEARGAIKFKEGDSYKKVIEIYKNADLSTVVHELGHYYLEVMGDLASRPDVSQQVKDDYASALEYLGVKSKDEIKTEQHELFAKTFEQYLLEGKSPAENLKGIFQAYGQYLKGVYSSAKGLDVPINDNIRNVFDRMIAVDESISSDDFINQAGSIIGDYKSWMNESDAQSFENALTRARESVNEKLYKKFLNDAVKERNQKLDFFRKDAERIISEDPLYNLVDNIKINENLKFDKAWIAENMPSGTLQKIRGLYKEGGIEPPLMAADLNLGNGVELITAIAELTPKNKMIDIAANARLEVENPELTRLDVIAAEATDAYVSDNLSKVMELEIKALASNEFAAFKKVVRKVQRTPMSTSRARSEAQKLFDSKMSKNDSSNYYFRAARKAGNEAMDALLKGDIDTAISKKETQFVNLEAYKLARKAKVERDKFMRLAKKINAISETKLEKLNRDKDLVLAAKALMANFGMPGRIRDIGQLIEPIKRYNEEKFHAIGARLSGLLELEKDINSFTNAEFEEFSSVIETLWKESGEINKIQIGREKFELSQIEDEAEAAFEPLKNKFVLKNLVSKYPSLKYMNSQLMKLLRFEYHAEAISGGDINHFIQKRVFRPIEEINQKIRSETTRYADKIQKIAKKRGIKISGKEIDVSKYFGLDADGKPRVMTDEQIISMLLHIGNDSNYKKLIVGNKLGRELDNGALDDAAFVRFINDMTDQGVIEKRHFDFAQDIWNLFEATKPDVQRAWKKRTGSYFREIQPREVVTKFGTYAGGYAPLTIDFDAVKKIKESANLEDLKVANASYSMPVLKGGGMGRSRQNVYLPIDLSLGRVQSSVQEFVRYINSADLVDVAKYVTSERVINAVNTVNPSFYENVLLPYLKRVDQQRATVDIISPDTRGLVAQLSKLQNRASAGIMFVNPQNILEMFGDFGQATAYVDKSYIAKSGVSLVKDRANVTEMIVNMSPYMKLRLERDAVAINEETGRLIGKDTALEKLSDFSREHAFIGQRIVDNLMTRTVWFAKYSEVMSKNSQTSQADAVFQADQAVRLSFGDNRASDKSAFEGNLFGKLTQVFYSWSNQKFNVLLAKGGQIARSERSNMEKSLKAGVLAAQTLVAPVAFSIAIRALLQGEAFDEDNDGAFLDDYVRKVARDTMSLSIRGVPFASDIAEKLVINRIIPERQFYGSRVTGLNSLDLYWSALDRAASGVGNFVIEGEKPGHAAYDSLVLMNLLMGVNLVPFGKGLKYWNEVQEGKSNADDLVDIVRGVTTGRARD